MQDAAQHNRLLQAPFPIEWHKDDLSTLFFSSSKCVKDLY